MYTVLFGLRRIEFFYSIFFYFDIGRAPAIALLPLWLANECYQYATLPMSRVAYLAHAGGLVSGAALAWMHRRRHGVRESASAAAERIAAAREAELAAADAFLRRLQFDRARTAFAALARKYPDDLRLLSRYYALSKTQPDSEDFQRAAGLIFDLEADDAAAGALQADTYRDYVRVAKSIHISTPQLFRLAQRFSASGQLADAATLLRILQRRAPSDPRLPGLFLRAAKAARSAGAARDAQELLDALRMNYPDSEETRIARHWAP